MSYEDNKKWRLGHTIKRNVGRKRYYKQTQGARNTGKRWSGEDKEEALFSGAPDRDLSREIGRSVAAIQVKRCKLWKKMYGRIIGGRKK